MTSHALLYYTHFVSDDVKAEIDNLARELSADLSLFAVGCCSDASTLNELASDRIKVRSYVRDDLRKLPYQSQLARVDWKTMRYSADLAIMRFFRGNPDFDFYWIIENDVRFTGSWNSLITELSASNADLLCSYVTTFNQNPSWMHWASFLSGSETMKKEDLVRAFFPVSRLSNRLMRAIDGRCQDGWAGQYEVLWTTIARVIGGKIEEIGGVGSAVPAERRGKYYYYSMSPQGLFLSTFAAWPLYSTKSAFHRISPPNILWHPVKE
jgi:hypothetical protein